MKPHPTAQHTRKNINIHTMNVILCEMCGLNRNDDRHKG